MCCSRIFFVVLILMMSALGVGNALNISLIAVLPNALSTAGLPYLGAPVELSVEDVNRRYSPEILHFSLSFITAKKLYYSCFDTRFDENQMLTEYYYKKHTSNCTAIIGTNCGDIFEYSKSAKEWDAIVFSSSMVTKELIDRKNFPTTLSLSATFERFGDGVMQVLSHYNWTHVSLLLDKSVAGLVYQEIATAITTVVHQQNSSTRGIILNLFYVYSQKNNSIVATLELIQKSSRVVILGMQADSAINILRIAKKMNMTNGNYAYINYQPVKQDLYGTVSQFSKPSEEDLEPFQSLLFMTPAGSVTEAAGALNNRIRNLTMSKYNATFEPGLEPLDLFPVLTAYETVEALAQIISASYPRYGNSVCSGALLARLMSDRKYNLTTGELYIDKNGAADVAHLLYGFSLTKNEMQVIARYNVDARSLVWLSNRTADWPRNSQPADKPLCGYTGLDGPCAFQVKLGPVILPIGIIIIVVCICLLTFWLRHLLLERTDWWNIPYNQLSVTDDAKPVTWKY